MSPELVATLLVPVAYGLLWAIEWRFPARAYVPIAGWRRLGLLFFGLTAVTGSLTPFLWKALGLPQAGLFDLRTLGWWGYPVGLWAISGLFYAWHRLAHRSDLLWRATHQLHHSAQRVDIPGAFFTHPLEVVVKSTLGFFGGTVVLGLDAPVAAMVSSTLTFLSLFQHWNVNTPRWVGYLLPRPEMHAFHHELGQHRRNYGDLPLWDLLFGTHYNPTSFEGQVGLGVPVAGRLSAMLSMRRIEPPGEALPGLLPVSTVRRNP